MMPEEFTLDTLPVPENDAIRFRTTDPERRITLQFSGRATTARLDQKAAELAGIARRNDVAIDPAPLYAFYDDPFTLPWNRRNEVSYRLR